MPVPAQGAFPHISPSIWVLPRASSWGLGSGRRAALGDSHSTQHELGQQWAEPKQPLQPILTAPSWMEVLGWKQRGGLRCGGIFPCACGGEEGLCGERHWAKSCLGHTQCAPCQINILGYSLWLHNVQLPWNEHFSPFPTHGFPSVFLHISSLWHPYPRGQPFRRKIRSEVRICVSYLI